jgi:transforming growth factor-beta-induced protein
MFRSRNWSLVLPLIAGLGAAACEGETGRPVYPNYDKTVWELAQAEGDLSKFVELGTTAGVDAFLTKNQATFTVMAPSNAAFAAAAGLDMDPLALNALLRFHMLSGTIDSSLLKLGGEFRTITATTVRIEPEGTVYKVFDHLGNSAQFTKTDVYGSNGVLLIIDKVLTPPPAPVMGMCGNGMMEEGEACDDGNMAAGDGCSATCTVEVAQGKLLAELTTAGLTQFPMEVMGTPLATTLDGTGPFTVFAPANAAFSELMDANAETIACVLSHHVVGGELNKAALGMDNPRNLTTLAKLPLSVTGDGAMVGGVAFGTKVDIEATNGVAHEVAAVLKPMTAIEYAAATMRLMRTSEAITAADMDLGSIDPDTLSGEAGVTLFLPSNMAWENAMIDIGMTSTATLANIIRSHATAGHVALESLTDGQTLTMLNGSTVTVDITGAVITLSNGMTNAVVTVDESDRCALTGMVHVVEALLDNDNMPN